MSTWNFKSPKIKQKSFKLIRIYLKKNKFKQYYRRLLSNNAISWRKFIITFI